MNAALMRRRKSARHPEVPIEQLLPRFPDDGHHQEPVTEWDMDAQAQLMTEETRLEVRACIDRLSEGHRTVLILRDIEELSTEETARILEVSENAVKIRLHRARQALASSSCRCSHATTETPRRHGHDRAPLRLT